MKKLKLESFKSFRKNLKDDEVKKVMGGAYGAGSCDTGCCNTDYDATCTCDACDACCSDSAAALSSAASYGPVSAY